MRRIETISYMKTGMWLIKMRLNWILYDMIWINYYNFNVTFKFHVHLYLPLMARSSNTKWRGFAREFSYVGKSPITATAVNYPVLSSSSDNLSRSSSSSMAAQSVGETDGKDFPSDLPYLSGFNNHFSSEAIPGALPQSQNSPLICPFGLYAEQISGTSFTSPRKANLCRCSIVLSRNRCDYFAFFVFVV